MLLLGQPKKIVDDLAKTQLTSAESTADLQTTVGRAHLALGKPEAAQAAFSAAITAVPGYAPALFGQARIKAAGRDLPGALALLDSALEKNPKVLRSDAIQRRPACPPGGQQGVDHGFTRRLSSRGRITCLLTPRWFRATSNRETST